MFPSTLHSLFKNLSNSECGITFINNSKDDLFVSYKEVFFNALNILGTLQKSGVKAGNEIVFQIQESQSFIEIFWACILGKIIPVPINFAVTTELKNKLQNVLNILNTPYLITSKENYIKNLSFDHDIISLLKRDVIFIEDLKQDTIGQIQEATKDDIAYIQFSSGSTGNPKGVILTHGNLISNIDSIHNGINSPEEGDSFFSWMPLTHDMGLIGFHLTPLAKGWSHYIMPTELFMRNPSLWLNKISQYKITFTSSPNFGYQYILKHFNPEKNQNIDLSSLRVIVNGAEPISKDICLRFNEYLKEYGLKENVIFPVYGLAEASLAVSFSQTGEKIYSIQVDRNKLNIGDQISLSENDESSINFVCVGTPIKNTYIRIVDRENNLQERTFIGKIQIKGDNVTSGYYQNKKDTEKLITSDGWLNTGDLGFQDVTGNLYIVGRDKDVIFVNGINFYSHDLERIVEKVSGIELGKIIITGGFNSKLSRDEIIAFVLYRGALNNFISIKNECEKVISEQAGINLDYVIPVKKIPKTTSGKVQRYKLLMEFLNNEYRDIIDQIRKLDYENSDKIITTPNCEIEEKILQCWKKILKREDVGVSDDFFVLGGNSLKAGQLLMILQEDLGLTFTFEEIYQFRTIKEISKLAKSKSTQKTEVIEKNKSKVFGLSHAQNRIYYYYQLNKKSLAYNIPQVFILNGQLDIDRLKIALSTLLKKYDILRTTFHIKSGEAYQQIHEDHIVSVDEMIIDQKNDLDEQIRNHVQAFILEELPLFRIKYASLSSGKHILLIDIHHIIADGSSLINLIDKLFKTYNGEDVEKPEVQYPDFVHWEEKYLKFDKTGDPQNYWKDCLQGEIPQLNLPSDFSGQRQNDDKGAKLFGSLGNDIHRSLDIFSENKQVSKSVILLSCYSLLLSKLTSQEDIIIGMAESGRNHVKFSDAIGMFVNNLPIRVFPKGDFGINQYLSDVNKQLIKALDNKSLPYNELLNILEIKNTKRRNPLFDTMFVYQNMDFPELSSNDLKIIHHRFDPKISKFDLTLEIFENKELDFALEYSSELFTYETIERFSGYFREIVKSVIDNPLNKIKDIEILSDVEKKRLVIDFNNTNSNVPSLLVHEIFEKKVKESPDSYALSYKEDKLTYQELDQKANSLASIMIDKGLKPDDFVVLMIDRSFEFIISVLGVLKAGGAYVPVDPAYPLSRKEYIIEDSKTRFIISTNDIIEANKSIIDNFNSDNIIRIDKLESYKLTEQKKVQVSPNNLAYMIYTSGTSGKPKGVMIEHRNLMNYIWWAQKVYVKGESVDFPLFSSVSFDLTVTSIFLPLITGNILYIYNEEDQRLLIQQVLHDDKVGVIKLTPSHLRLIKEDHAIKAENVTNLKRFVVGGEDLTAELAIEISKKFNNKVEIFNEYGPTEATVGCMTYKFNDKKEYHKSVPIGKPSDNSKIFILDKYLNAVVQGVTGEIFIGGESVARGYYNKNVLTEDKFIIVPELSDQKLYRTGDLAKFINSETIEFVGRSDHQIKLNGYRIELDEIELCIQEFEGVSNAVVSRVDNNGTSLLCAYYVSENGIDELNLKQHLQDCLPHYMVPSLFFNIDKVPLTPNGKVDKEALPEIEALRISKEFKAAEDSAQELLVNIFQNVLNIQPISINDNFFELGGDSIKAVQITSRLNDKGFTLNVNDILLHQTISQISLYVKKTVREYDQGLVVGQKQLSPIDKWFFEKEFKNPNYYNQSALLEFKVNINKEILEKVFGQLIQHHDGLRMNYDPLKGCMFYNNDHLTETLNIEVFNINELSELESIGEKLKSSFDIANSLLIKCGIIRIKDGQELLLITVHHLLIDGLSWRILLEDLYNMYEQLISGNKVQLPKKTGSLSDWQNALSAYAESEELKSQLDYWKQIDDKSGWNPETNNISNLNVGCSKCTININNEKTEYLLKDANKVYNTDIQILLLSALVKSVQEVFGTDNMILELENYGRTLDNIDVSRTIGWFTAMYPVMFKMKDLEIDTIIKEVKEKVKNVPKQGIGYGVLKYITKDIRKSINEGKRIRFNYLGQFGVEVSNEIFTYSTKYTGAEIALDNNLTYCLEVNCMIINSQLDLELNFSNSYFNGEDINRLKNSYLENVDIIISYLKNKKDIYFTPSDFDTVDLDDEELAILFSDDL